MHLYTHSEITLQRDKYSVYVNQWWKYLGNSRTEYQGNIEKN